MQMRFSIAALILASCVNYAQGHSNELNDSAELVAEFSVVLLCESEEIGPELRVRLKNLSESSFRLPSEQAPWVVSSSALKLQQQERPNAERRPIFSDGELTLRAAEIVLPPGTSLEGRIRLKGETSGFFRLLAEQPMFLTWDYAPSYLVGLGRIRGRTGGMYFAIDQVKSCWPVKHDPEMRQRDPAN